MQEDSTVIFAGEMRTGKVERKGFPWGGAGRGGPVCRRWEWAGSIGERRGSGWQGEDLAGDGERVGQVFRKQGAARHLDFPRARERTWPWMKPPPERCPRRRLP